MMKRWLMGAALGVVGGSLVAVRLAAACGCFTPPDPSVPVVQAGERILFAVENGEVTAHIQIQYAGNAAEFGWLLPLPSVPSLELGTDELFNQLTTTTQPKYRLTAVYEGNCPSLGINNGGGSASAPGADGAGGGEHDGGLVVVVQDAIGPYDYAVLQADSQAAMLKWLADNRYFVPAGTDTAVVPYIHAGAYFLALKLRSGRSTGDLQPVVVKYASDLPMIPIVLTSVGAKPDMGIQVWIAGQGRAIPRNYYHTVINDAEIDWLNAGQNYNDVIIAATKEAEGRHTFVTEYAGPSSVMQNVLDPPGRFGSRDELAAQADAVSFVTYMNEHGYPTYSPVLGGGGPFSVQPVYTSQTLAVLERYIPVPAIDGLQPAQFYADIGYYLGTYRDQNPSQFVGYTIDYRPADMAAELDERVVQPTLAAGALFKHFPYLTRLYTTLSPENMNRDPVFSENRDLPPVSNVHEGTLTYHCGLFGADDLTKVPATVRTEQGWTIEYPHGVGTITPLPEPLPASERIETLGEEGMPNVVVDNQARIGDLLGQGGGGCAVGAGGGRGFGGALFLLGLMFLARRRRAP